MRYLFIILLFIPPRIFAQLHDGLSVYYALDATSGTQLTDSVGTNHGTLTGGVVNETGILGKCILFDGVGDVGTLPDISGLQFGSGDFSISVWVNPTAFTTSWKGILGGEAGSFAIGTYGSSGQIYISKIGIAGAATGLYMSTGSWYHIVVVFNGTTKDVTVYLNGISSTVNFNYTFDTGAASNLIGNIANGQNIWQGYIDELAIWDNTLLTSIQVSQLYNSGNGLSFSDFTEETGYLGYENSYINGQSVIRHIPGLPSLRAYNYIKQTISLPSDTIEYILAEDFETWSTSDFATIGALTKKWDVWTNGMKWDQQTIVDVGGSRGNVWNAEIKQGEWESMVINVCLADTFNDIWMSNDLYFDPAWEAVGIGGGTSSKTSAGFFGGNSYAITGRDSSGTLNALSGAGWAHEVNGSAGIMGYIYSQGFEQFPGESWDENAFARGDSGYIPFPRGYWINVTRHYKYSDPGKFNGFLETYINGVLVSRVTGFKTRSIAQGRMFGIEAAQFSYFFGGSHTLTYAAPRDQYIRIDNAVVYRYKPSAKNYRSSWRALGSTIPIIRPFDVGGVVRPEPLLVDETYTNASDTIYDVGNGKNYIYNPPNDTAYVTKTVIRPSGTINYSFLIKEWGFPPDETNQSYWVKVYSGTGIGKTLLKTFGRSDAGYENPTVGATFTINDNEATFEFHTGWAAFDNRGVAIRYWQP